MGLLAAGSAVTLRHFQGSKSGGLAGTLAGTAQYSLAASYYGLTGGWLYTLSGGGTSIADD